MRGMKPGSGRWQERRAVLEGGCLEVHAPLLPKWSRVSSRWPALGVRGRHRHVMSRGLGGGLCLTPDMCFRSTASTPTEANSACDSSKAEAGRGRRSPSFHTGTGTRVTSAIRLWPRTTLAGKCEARAEDAVPPDLRRDPELDSSPDHFGDGIRDRDVCLGLACSLSPLCRTPPTSPLAAGRSVCAEHGVDRCGSPT